MTTTNTARRFFLALDGDTVWGAGSDPDGAVNDARQWCVDEDGDEDCEAVALLAVHEVGGALARRVAAGEVSVRSLGLVITTDRDGDVRSVEGGWTAREAAARLRRECASYTVALDGAGPARRGWFVTRGAKVRHFLGATAQEAVAAL
jgi:hypothetical protein